MTILQNLSSHKTKITLALSASLTYPSSLLFIGRVKLRTILLSFKESIFLYILLFIAMEFIDKSTISPFIVPLSCVIEIGVLCEKVTRLYFLEFAFP